LINKIDSGRKKFLERLHSQVAGTITTDMTQNQSEVNPEV